MRFQSNGNWSWILYEDGLPDQCAIHSRLKLFFMVSFRLRHIPVESQGLVGDTICDFRDRGSINVTVTIPYQCYVSITFKEKTSLHQHFCIHFLLCRESTLTFFIPLRRTKDVVVYSNQWLGVIVIFVKYIAMMSIWVTRGWLFFTLSFLRTNNVLPVELQTYKSPLK